MKCYQPRYSALTALGDAMDEIPADVLRQIRELNDVSLRKLIEAINSYGWVKAADELRLMVAEKETTQ